MKMQKMERTAGKWVEECPSCGINTSDGYGTCEYCGEWTTGKWVEDESSDIRK